MAEGFYFVSNSEPFRPNPKFLDAGFRNEAEIALDVHDLVVAVHGDDGAAVPCRVALELLEEVEDLELVAAAVEDVADLDHGGGAAGVAVGGVDDAGKAQGLLGLGEVAVEVANGDKTWRRGEARGERWRGRRRRREEEATAD